MAKKKIGKVVYDGTDLMPTKWNSFEEDPDRTYLTVGELIDALLKLDSDAKVKVNHQLHYYDVCDIEVEMVIPTGKVVSVALVM